MLIPTLALVNVWGFSVCVQRGVYVCVFSSKSDTALQWHIH